MLVTHDMREAMRLADHVVVMEEGRISSSRAAEDLRQDNPDKDPEELLQLLMAETGP